MNIHLVGNESQAEDSIPFLLKPALETHFPGVRLVRSDPTEEFIPLEGDIIIDAVQGISEPTVFSSLTHFSRPPRISVHDYDLFLHLSLLLKLKRIQSFTIIGVPQKVHGIGVLGKQVAGLVRQIISRQI